MQKLFTLWMLLLILCSYTQAQTIIKQNTQKPKQLLSPSPTPLEHKIARTGFEKTPQVSDDMPESFIDVIIGQSQYDLQSNAALGSRLVFRADGSLAAAWCQSQDPSFADRGTGYNESNTNSEWPWNNNMRIESERTGFPCLVVDGNGQEHIFSHTLNGEILHARKSQNTWQESYVPLQATSGGYWAKVAANGNTIHLIYLTIPIANGGSLVDGMDGQLLYCRSQDAGQSWDKIDIRLPGIDISKYNGISAEEYSIDVSGSTVSIAIHPTYGDIQSIVSRDNGETFTNRVVQDFLFDKWDQGQVDSNLILAANDPMAPEAFSFLSTDGSGTTLIDHNGMVHVWYSSMYTNASDTIGGLPNVFLDYNSGIFYWNESMSDNTAEVAAFSPDVDMDGMYGHPDQTEFYTEYGYPVCTQPSVGIAQNGEIFLVFSAPNELDLNSSNGTLFRKAFICRRSITGGWSVSFAVNNEFNSDASLTPFQEHIFPSISRTVSDSVNIITAVDYTQGTNLNQGNTDITNFHYLPVSSNLATLQLEFISGTIYADENNNGVQDASEVPIQGININLNGIPRTTSAQDGSYKIPVFTASQSVLSVVAPNHASANPASLTIQSNQLSEYDFGLYFQPNITDACLTVTAIQAFRPGFETEIFTLVRNAGSIAFDGTLKVALDPTLEYLSAFPTPTQILGDTLVWNLQNFPPFTVEDFVIEVKTPVGTPLGQEIKIHASVIPTEPDSYRPNNFYTLCEPVVGSYDPNDKRCVQGDIFTPQQLADTMALEYIIRFQNTGTYQADFVRVQDTMSTNLDLASFEFLASSHDCDVTIKDGRVVDFFFPNINLPDSTSNEPESHGFIHYRIHPKLDLELGESIENTAYIYFDFNPPIITNTTQTDIAEIIRVWERPDVEALQIAPNPSKGILRLTLPENESGYIIIFNAQGQRVFEKKAQSTREILDLSQLPNGMYSIHWIGTRSARRAGQFVLQR